MISRQKWGRLIGHRNPGMREPPPPDELHVVSSDVTRMFPPHQGVAGGSGAYGIDTTIDPPAGGLAANLSPLFQAPRDSGDFGIINAQGGAFDGTFFFHPGIYRVSCKVQSAFRTELIRAGLVFEFVPAAGLVKFPWGGVGGGTLWREATYFPATATATIQSNGFDHRLFIPVAWAMVCNVGQQTLIDADVFNVHLTIDPEYVLDEPGSALGW